MLAELGGEIGGCELVSTFRGIQHVVGIVVMRIGEVFSFLHQYRSSPVGQEEPLVWIHHH